MVGVLDSLRGKASLAGQWAKGLLSEAVDTASRPSNKKLVETAEKAWHAGYAAHYVPIIDEAVEKGLSLDPLIKEAYPQLIRNAAAFDPLGQEGALALAQLAQRGDEGRKAFLDFCERREAHAAGARVIELMITNGGEAQRGFFGSPAFTKFSEDVFQGAERNKGTVADTVDLTKRRESVFGYLEDIKTVAGPAIESPN